MRFTSISIYFRKLKTNCMDIDRQINLFFCQQEYIPCYVICFEMFWIIILQDIIMFYCQVLLTCWSIVCTLIKELPMPLVSICEKFILRLMVLLQEHSLSLTDNKSVLKLWEQNVVTPNSFCKSLEHTSSYFRGDLLKKFWHYVAIAVKHMWLLTTCKYTTGEVTCSFVYVI